LSASLLKKSLRETVASVYHAIMPVFDQTFFKKFAVKPLVKGLQSNGLLKNPLYRICL